MNSTIETRALKNGDVQVIAWEEIRIVNEGLVRLGVDLERRIQTFVARVKCGFSSCRVNHSHGSITILSNDTRSVRNIRVCNTGGNCFESFL